MSEARQKNEYVADLTVASEVALLAGEIALLALQPDLQTFLAWIANAYCRKIYAKLYEC